MTAILARGAQFLRLFCCFLFRRAIFVFRVLGHKRGRAPSAPAFDKIEKENDMAKVLTKSQIIQTLAEAHKDKLARKDVARLLESLTTVGHKELKKNGIFVLPGFAKFVVVKKPATKERQGINPFTKEPITIKAKPARKVLKARPVKAAKDALA